MCRVHLCAVVLTTLPAAFHLLRFAAVRLSNVVSMTDGMGPRRKFVVAVLRLALATVSTVSSWDNSSFLAESSCRCSRCCRTIAEDETIS